MYVLKDLIGWRLRVNYLNCMKLCARCMYLNVVIGVHICSFSLTTLTSVLWCTTYIPTNWTKHTRGTPLRMMKRYIRTWKLSTHPKVTTKFTVGQPNTKAFSGETSAIANSLTFSEIHTSAIGTQYFNLKLRFCLDFPDGLATSRRSSNRNRYRRRVSELGCSRKHKYDKSKCHTAKDCDILKQTSQALRGGTSLKTFFGHYPSGS